MFSCSRETNFGAKRLLKFLLGTSLFLVRESNSQAIVKQQIIRKERNNIELKKTFLLVFQFYLSRTYNLMLKFLKA